MGTLYVHCKAAKGPVTGGAGIQSGQQTSAMGSPLLTRITLTWAYGTQAYLSSQTSSSQLVLTSFVGYDCWEGTISQQCFTNKRNRLGESLMVAKQIHGGPAWQW